MVKTIAYIKIIRPVNTVITGCAVALGIWLTSGALPGIHAAASGSRPVSLLSALLLMAAAMAAAAYGNVINDLFDIQSDRISHPKRPLVSGAMAVRPAAKLAAGLAALSLVCAAAASAYHLIAAAVPLLLLTLYSIYLKRTIIAGNILVALLTGYALLFGSLPRPETKILIVPAVLAFLLNFCRETIKDVQDAEGDRAAGWKTSAALPMPAIKAMLAGAAAVYAVFLLLPAVLGHFGWVYAMVCLIAVAPFHLCWVMMAMRPEYNKYLGWIGLALKMEMVMGLMAMALDRVVRM